MSAHLDHIETVLNDAHLTLCDAVVVDEQRDWEDDEKRLLAMIDAAITQVHGMRMTDVHPL